MTAFWVGRAVTAPTSPGYCMLQLGVLASSTVLGAFLLLWLSGTSKSYCFAQAIGRGIVRRHQAVMFYLYL